MIGKSKKILKNLKIRAGLSTYFSEYPELLTEVDDALLVPQTSTTDFGFGDDQFIHGIIDRNRESSQPFLHHMRRDRELFNKALFDKYMSKQEIQNSLEGSWMYAGGIFPHFGHVLAECIHRLWAWRHLKRRVKGILFAAKPDHQILADLPDHVTEILQFLCVPLEKVGLINQLTEIEHVLVPAPGHTMIGHPHEWYSEQLKYLVNKKKYTRSSFPEKIHVSRRNYAQKGRVLGMDTIENILENDGYQIVCPEEYSLEKQISYICSAKKIIWEEGSALHLLEILNHIEAENFLISRRPFFAMFKRLLDEKSSRYIHYTAVQTLPDVFREDEVKYDSMALLEEPDDLLNELEREGFLSKPYSVPAAFLEQEHDEIVKYLNSERSLFETKVQEFNTIVNKFRTKPIAN